MPVWVVAVPVPLPRRDACSAWGGGDGATPVIVVAATTAGDRRRFSVAHEVGHLVLHQVPQGAPHALEQQADAFAEAFLLPAAAMRQALVPPITLTTLADRKARWGVSLQALIRRARTLGIVSDSHYRALSAQLGARGWRTREPVAVPVERPRGEHQKPGGDWSVRGRMRLSIDMSQMGIVKLTAERKNTFHSAGISSGSETLTSHLGV